MKLMVASDIHGPAYYCKEMLAAFDREQADRLLLLGDLLYHGPRNDLPRGYAPKEVAAMLNERKAQLLCVRGNCDAEVDQMMLAFSILAEHCILYLGGRMAFATHGHHFHKDAMPPLQPGDILLHGHTHVPAWEPVGNGNLYLDPGSVSLPKQDSAHGCLLLTEQRAVWKDLSGTTYHSMPL